MTGVPRPTETSHPLAVFRDARSDLKYAVRLFARQRTILVLTVAGLSLGLGIGTAAFSIMNAALRGEGVVDPDRAPGVLRTTARSVSTAWTYEEFRRLREEATQIQLEAVTADTAGVRLAPDEPPRSASVAFVSAGFFEATGGRVVLGRPLRADDEREALRSGAPPAVVSFIFWTSRLNRDPDAVGRTIWIGGSAARIVGIAARGFSVPGSRMAWMPLSAYGSVYGTGPGPRDRTNGSPDMVQVFGRLLPGVRLSEAQAQLTTLSRSTAGASAGRDLPTPRLDPHAGLGRMAPSDALETAVTVSAVIGLMLLLACANVATVLVSTAITRERELGVRAALGATRVRIVRQLVTESLTLGTIGAFVGFVFACWAIPVIGRMLGAPAGAELAPDLRAYFFLGAAALVTGVAAGLAPAWHARGVDLSTALKGEGAAQNRVGPRRMRSILVAAQAAASIVLIVLASLFVRATFRAAATDVGFDAAGLYAVSPGVGDAFTNRGAALRTRNLWTRALPELRSMPGIAAITLAELSPFGDATISSITRDGLARVVYFNRTDEAYFTTLGLRILAGRAYTRGEIAAGAPVALVSRSLALAYWPGRSPIGTPLPESIPVSSARPVIIGVVADAITARLHERDSFAVYEPLGPADESLAEMLIRVAPGTTGVVQRSAQRLRAIDPQADIRIMSVADRLEEEAGRPRMLAALTGFVGFVAVLLCVIGLYGLTASVVSQRTRELGVRIALGADRRDLLRVMMWDNLKPVAWGLWVGAAAAFVAGRAASAWMFFGVSPHDPLAIAGSATILITAAAVAVLGPTRRAATVDPARVLRRA